MFPLENCYTFLGELLIWYELHNGNSKFEDVESFQFGLLQPPIGTLNRTYFLMSGVSVLTGSPPSCRAIMNASIRDAFSAFATARLGEASDARCAMHAITSTSCSVGAAMSTSARIAVATASKDDLESLLPLPSNVTSLLLGTFPFL